MDEVYIPLGADCSIAYQLQKLGLRTCALPFDWIRCNNLENIMECITNNFQIFIDPKFLVVEDTHSKFPYLETDDFSDDVSEHIIVKHVIYGIKFPHDFKSSIETEIESAKEKYQRRINRFYEIIANPKIKKIFVRIDNKKTSGARLDEFFSKICDNFIIKHIIPPQITYTSWKKDELDWKSLFYFSKEK
jgi:hypothetical protein